MTRLIAVLLASMTLMASTYAQAPMHLRPIKNPIFEGCMCELYLDTAKAKPLFLSDLAGDVATLNIDFNDVKVPLARTTKKQTYWEPGETFERVYLYQKASVAVTFKAGAYRGEVGEGELEGWPMEATVVYSIAGRKYETIKALGACGC